MLGGSTIDAMNAIAAARAIVAIVAKTSAEMPWKVWLACSPCAAMVRAAIRIAPAPRMARTPIVAKVASGYPWGVPRSTVVSGASA